MHVRPFHNADSTSLIEILTLNGQYDYPEIAGPDAMRRVAACDAAIFLIAEVGGQAQGPIRGIYGRVTMVV